MRKASTSADWRQLPPAASRPCTRRRARLASGLGAAADDGGDLFEGHSEDVVEHEGHPLGRGQRVEHHHQGQSDRVAEQCLGLGVGTGVRLGELVGEPASDLERRAWSTFRHTRDTTVVSQLPRFAISLVSERLKRIQASWTASSASEASQASDRRPL